jgi:hypothetical protein
MKQSELNQLIKEEIKKALKEASIPENTLMAALKKAGIEVEDDMNVELKGPTGKTKIVTVNPDGKVTMDEGIKDKLVIAATCLVLASGLVSCTKPDNSDLRPNNAQTEMPSGEENAAPVDFLNTSGKTVTINNILAGLGKYTPKPKTTKGDTTQYKQMVMKPNIKNVEVKPDSVITNSNTPWIGYWKFTDKCRSDNQQVMIWSQVGDNPLDGIIYSGYQVGPEFSSWKAYSLIDGKGYFLSTNKIKSFNYDKAKSHITVTMSAPDVDQGAIRTLEIDYNGKSMNITNWGSGNAVQVSGMSGFKW